MSLRKEMERPTILVCAESHTLGRWVVRNLPPEYASHLHIGPMDPTGADEGLFETSNLLVIATGRLDSGYARRMREMLPGVPCVAVTGSVLGDDDEIPALMSLAIDEVVGTNQVECDLARKIRKLVVGAWRHRIWKALRRSHGVSLEPARFRSGLLAWFINPEARRSVLGLAASCGCRPRTIQRWWARSHLPGSPRCLIDWLIVLDVSLLAPLLGSIEDATTELGVERERFYRVLERRLGVPPEELDADEALQRFCGWWAGADEEDGISA